MKEDLKHLSAETCNLFLWPENEFIQSEQSNFDDWLCSLANSFGG